MAHVKVLEKRAAEMSRDHNLNRITEILLNEVGTLSYAQIEAIRCGYYRGMIETATARIGTYVAKFGSDVLAVLAKSISDLADQYRARDVFNVPPDRLTPERETEPDAPGHQPTVETLHTARLTLTSEPPIESGEPYAVSSIALEPGSEGVLTTTPDGRIAHYDGKSWEILDGDSADSDYTGIIVGKDDPAPASPGTDDFEARIIGHADPAAPLADKTVFFEPPGDLAPEADSPEPSPASKSKPKAKSARKAKKS